MKNLFLVLISAVGFSSLSLAENNRPDAKELRPDLPSPALAETFGYNPVTQSYRVNPARTVELVGFVGFNAVSAGAQMLTLFNSLAPITVVINSPGGSVTAGEVLMSAMDMARHAGIRVDCVVIGASYSMGFNTLGSCDKIYASPSATFLFHPVRATVESPLRAIDAVELARDLQKIDNKYLALAQRVTGLSSDVVKKAYYAEKLWSEQELPTTMMTRIKLVYGLSKNALEFPNKEMFERMRKDKKDSLPKVIFENNR